MSPPLSLLSGVELCVSSKHNETCQLFPAGGPLFLSPLPTVCSTDLLDFSSCTLKIIFFEGSNVCTCSCYTLHWPLSHGYKFFHLYGILYTVQCTYCTQLSVHGLCMDFPLDLEDQRKITQHMLGIWFCSNRCSLPYISSSGTRILIYSSVGETSGSFFYF